MKMEQMMERLLAKIDARMDTNTKAVQEMVDTDREEWKQEIRVGQEHLKEEMKAQMASLVSRIEDNNEKFRALQGTLISQMDRQKSKMDTWIADMKEGRKEMMACQQAMEANP
jgi:hypothetical protein